MKYSLPAALLFLMVMSLKAQDIPAFPGAEGGGMYTTGGRGGTVYYVNTLEDNSTGNTTTREGSLRWCVERSGKRTIVFKVGGVITLTKRLDIKNGDLTIAGQTAPGGGICLRDYEVVINADNVIIRYMRFRLGDRITTHEPDAFWGRYRKNIMIDHCSMSWSIDECASFYSNQNFTLQWCILSESLNESLHGKGSHGYGGIWGGKNATFHHNLLAHHKSRNPRFNGWNRSGLNGNPFDEERVDYRNNVIYNWGDNSAYGGESSGKYNMVANYYKYGPATKSGVASRIVQISMDGSPQTYSPGYGQFYITGNYVYGNATVTANNWKSPGIAYDSGVTEAKARVDEPFESNPITQHSAELAFERVLAYGGASLSRDDVDARVAEEARTGTATFKGSKGGRAGLIDSQEDLKPAGAGSDWSAWTIQPAYDAPVDTDRDGIPDGWLNENFPGKLATDTNEEGYTLLEVYLNSLVEAITTAQNAGGVNTSIPEYSVNRQRPVRLSVSDGGRYLSCTSDEEMLRADVFDLMGRQLASSSAEGRTFRVRLPVAGLSAIYVVSIQFAGDTKPYVTKIKI